MIDTLIDKQDSFEIVRDKIALILAEESANQMALATSASKDPDLWKLRVFLERSNPWETFIDPPQLDTSPIVSVGYESGSFDPSRSDIVRRQLCSGVFNIDCYGYGVSSDEPGSGHNPGDKMAAFEAQRAIRLVRNILMADLYCVLDLLKLVSLRWPESINIFPPQQESYNGINVVGARMQFRVEFNEFSPQQTPSFLETVHVDLKRSETGQILASMQYDYPLT